MTTTSQTSEYFSIEACDAVLWLAAENKRFQGMVKNKPEKGGKNGCEGATEDSDTESSID